MPTISKGVDYGGLDKKFRSQVDALIAEAESRGGKVVIESGYRSTEKQRQLYESGNGGVPVAKPGTSRHEKGLAADIRGTDPKTQQLLFQLAPKYGLVFPLQETDPNHVQLSGDSGGSNLPITDGATQSAPSTPQPIPLGQRFDIFAQMMLPNGLAPNTEVDTSAVTGTSTMGTEADTSAATSMTADQLPKQQVEMPQAQATQQPIYSTGPVKGVTQEQMGNAATIVSVGRARGMSDRDIQIAIATALQESGLRNLNRGDRDSLGLFQQRPSQGWGSAAQVTDPTYAANKFYDGLSGIKNRDSLPLTVAAQKVQRSAFPDAYAKHEGLARQIVGSFR